MQKWQKTTRWVMALTAIVFAIAVAVTLKKRVTPQVQAPLTRTDEKAVLETSGGKGSRTNRSRSELQITWDKMLTYEDGSSKLIGLKVITDRNGKTFEITGKEGKVGDGEAAIEMHGNVHVKVSDGLEVTSEEATFTKADGIARAPGVVKFSRGHMSGSGVGFVYDNNQDILTIRDHAVVHVTADAKGNGAMDVATGGLEFRRRERILNFSGGMRGRRERETIDADGGVAHLTEDQDHLEALQLRGHSTITTIGAMAGGLQALSGRDVDLKYGPDGRLIEHALINGEALIRLAGEGQQSGREISANTIDLSLAADGATPTALTARESVALKLPAETNRIARKIDAQLLECKGDSEHGLTSAHFTGAVQFSEIGPDVNRAARSEQLTVAIKPGFSEIDDAQFSRRVRFVDGGMTATAAAAHYLPDRGTLALTGSERENPVPHVVNDQIQVDAGSVNVTLDGPIVHAVGSVKSVIQPQKPDAKKDAGSEVRIPAMLKQDQPVNVTADRLEYDGDKSQATYTGAAQLWQGETVIKAPSLVIDSKHGNLEANGPVATVSILQQQVKSGAVEKVRSVGTANGFKYEDTNRRATYTGDAHLNGPEGDVTAQRIELYLKESGDELDRVEAYDAVTLHSESSKTTGLRLTYFDADGRYVVRGTPVTTVDSCGRETTGRTLTFFKATDRIIVDGNEQIRTQTKGKSNCSGTSR
jgi:lipopolysaccharide transport protein LptA/LPS export ABC transporter protein LptC